MNCPSCHRFLTDDVQKCPSCFYDFTAKVENTIITQVKNVEKEVLKTTLNDPETFVSRINPKSPWNFEEDVRNAVLFLYILSIVGMIIPFGNLIVPIIFYKAQKNLFNPELKIYFKRLVNFQLLFSLFFYPYFAIVAASIFALNLLIYVPFLIVVLILMVVFWLLYMGKAIKGLLFDGDYMFPITLHIVKESNTKLVVNV